MRARELREQEPAAKLLQVIEATDGQLITNRMLAAATVLNDGVVADPARDILKIAVVNRYQDAPPAVGFMKNFGLRTGAIASSVAHDSHNIVAVGASDEDLCEAVNLIMEHRGCLAVAANDLRAALPLPVAGLMSIEDGFMVGEEYARLDQLARDLGSPLGAPFMTLSFMALLVIPSLRISDHGLFDADRFAMTTLFAE